ncbi:DUF1275 domain-containing protein [Arsenicitalea aurantiaca]|uniref:DUF1275 domain-containing protein n=1 Tax=Arsenicitalea aurantiaca TaxID=1783274 RepID=A0A433X8A2_9HYPH|nr:YoaK family protein [Arsenicitalea aurantiaca]RUT30296.1 DUF1275 domain-containing protein [Arsenicitalea aurantiaca]
MALSHPPLRRLGRLRLATAHRRTRWADGVLALVLTFVAGAVNAGGFLAIGWYTSHMTGIVSLAADSLVLGALDLVWPALLAVLAFIAGAASSAVLVNWGRRNRRSRQYAYPILFEAALLLGFGGLAAVLGPDGPFGPLIGVLCFIMGLQNATVTKLSGARIRTTHLTGMITDIGIEIGKALYREARDDPAHPVRADREKLKLLLGLVSAFFLGGLSGAIGFSVLGFPFTIPLALLLTLIALPRIGRRKGRATRPLTRPGPAAPPDRA